MGWKGPYEVVEKLSPLDYRIRISGKEKSWWSVDLVGAREEELYRRYDNNDNGNCRWYSSDGSAFCFYLYIICK